MHTVEEPLLEALRAEWMHLMMAATEKIEHCLSQLEDEQVCMRPGPGLNSIANQLAHITGNLRQWSLAGFGLEPDQRDREREFADWEPTALRGLKQELVSTVGSAYNLVSQVTAAELLRVHDIQGFRVSGLQALSHTFTHFVGHTHQIVQLTRWHLGSSYDFHWTTESPRDRVPI